MSFYVTSEADCTMAAAAASGVSSSRNNKVAGAPVWAGVGSTLDCHMYTQPVQYLVYPV